MVLELLNGSRADRITDPDLHAKGPRKALKSFALSLKSDAEKAAWLEQARVDAILGSCKGSMPSVRSGVACYIAFVQDAVGSGLKYFPPKLD